MLFPVSSRRFCKRLFVSNVRTQGIIVSTRMVRCFQRSFSCSPLSRKMISLVILFRSANIPIFQMHDLLPSRTNDRCIFRFYGQAGFLFPLNLTFWKPGDGALRFGKRRFPLKWCQGSKILERTFRPSIVGPLHNYPRDRTSTRQVSSASLHFVPVRLRVFYGHNYNTLAGLRLKARVKFLGTTACLTW